MDTATRRARSRIAVTLWLLAIVAGGCGEDEPSLTSSGQPAQGDTSTGGGGGSVSSDASQADSRNGGAGAIGKPCASKGDCSLFGLSCFETNAATGAGICSKTCTSNADCGGGTWCNPQSGSLICTPPRFCNPCTSNVDCYDSSPGAKNDGILCIATPSGGYCSRRCSLADNVCAPASSCKQFGDKIDDFACQPDSGQCVGDGNHCSPCASQADCKGATECHYAASTGERFCAQTCVTPGSNSECPSGFVCSQPKGSSKAYCFKQVGKEAIATCAKPIKQFCEPCNADYECASNRCALKNSKKFCVHPDPCSTNATCPYGGEATFCVPSDNGKGNICAPPLSWGCQGFLSCLGHACSADEKCVNGFCQGG